MAHPSRNQTRLDDFGEKESSACLSGFGSIRRGVALLAAFCVFLFANASPNTAWAQASPSKSLSNKAKTGSINEKTVSYEEHLRFYLDVKTKDFLIDMAEKELILLQTIENIIAEIKQRGVEGLVRDEPGFDLIYKRAQTLTESYAAELEAILAVIDEISALAQTLEKERRYGLLDQFQDLKARLMAALDNRELYKKAPATTGHVTGLIKEYHVEIDSLLRMYNRLEKFQRLATTKGDTAILPLLEKQKTRILAMMSDMKSDSSTGRTPDFAKAFLQEAEQVWALLSELDKLEKTSATSVDEAIEIETVRRNIVSQIDNQLLRLLGYNEHARKPTLDQAFNVWRGARLADYHATAAQYAIMKKRLIETGDEKVRARMLERDLTDALLNYAAERYRVAELQLTLVMQDYSSYFGNWDAVMFYRAESFYARALYPSAYESYEELLRTYPDSKFLGMTLLRLLTIAHTLKWEQPFFTYYQRIDSSDFTSEKQKRKNSINSRIVERARYLAGYFCLNLGKYAEAEAALSRIPPSSRYHFAAQYLRGIAQANLGNLSAACQHFQYIADTEGSIAGLTLTDPINTLIRNNALMRLGFIYYQRGELETAIRCFDRVSRGAQNYDQALIGLSWSYLKRGDFSKTIAAAGTVLSNYLSSNYQYEALVLSAHCRRWLNQPEAALEDLRYVTNARGVLELSREYNEERQQILAQLAEVDRMEMTALENQDRQLYNIISEVRQALLGLTQSFGYRSNTGTMLIDAFSEERQNIYRQLQQLDRLAVEARQYGLIDAEQDAIERRNRLVRVLETYQADRSIRNVNYFIDYPLATKESGAAYRQQIVTNLFKEMEAEQERLKQNLAAANKLISDHGDTGVNLALDLKTVQEDFKNLKYRMDRFQTWLSNYKIDDVTTDADQWADLSGYGMSDIAFQELSRRERKIEQYSQNISSIDGILRDRKSSLEQMLKDFDKGMRKIEEELLNEQVRLDQLEHLKYFQNSYFDTSESEVQTAVKQPTANEILDEP